MDFIRLGDTTDHGGKVVSASSSMTYDGKALARQGDLVICPTHAGMGSNRITEGDHTMTDQQTPLARHGHRASCGCRLISSLK